MGGIGNVDAARGDGVMGDGTISPCTSPSFGAPRAFPSGMQPWSVAAGDVDGDGLLDLVVMNDLTNSTVGILRGAGDGTFGAPQTIAIGMSDAQLIVLADVNKDSALDLVMEIGGGIYVALGDGAGNFGTMNMYIAGGAGFPSVIGVYDFDGDGNLDIAGLPPISQTANVQYGDGAGGFTTVTMSPTFDGFPIGFGAADLDGDGRADFVVGIASPAELEIFKSTATRGMFTVSKITSGVGGGYVLLGDLDHDGMLDVIDDLRNGNVALLRGLGGGTFGAATSGTIGGATGGPGAMSLVDVDGDGSLDLLATDEFDSALDLSRGNGTVGFDAYVPISIPGPNGIAVGDFDRDGHLDLAVADRGTSSVQIVLQKCM
jgi:hypothetical protein